ncbi:hypothetical protein [Moritella sp. Urea-trap-13]|uniref:hypothetical protein n=1 Tax=Moritella sp. Urea-trap-13 TaxID=2058327 RepID=UPI000C34DBBD|nr:hypothetical protein [Moritella sp. Urea-trap-13]PKH07044.1 hypothetical protein CXF93_14305 [Moritella sp. Urea-trap-13]
MILFILSVILFENITFLIFSGGYMADSNQHVNVLIEHFKNVIKPAFLNVRVISYILVSVVFVGGAGIWMPWAKEAQITSWLPGSTVFTYSFALLGSIICNRLYFYTSSLKEIRSYFNQNLDDTEIDNRFNEYEKRSILSAWGMLLGSFIILLVTFSYAKYYASDSVVGWLGLILSILLYFFASAEDVDNSSSVLPVPKSKQDAEPIFTPQDDDTSLNSDFFGNGSDD